MPELPSGTVTFLFTDIEGSTRLVKELRERYAELLADHQRLLREAIEQAGGQEIDAQGDAFFVAFRRAGDAVRASVVAQRALAAHPWPAGTEVKVRMGVHTAEPEVGADRYVGLGVHRAARICSAGHGGQILVSNATRELVVEDLPDDVALRDLGEWRLKDLDRPERLFQLVGGGLADDFPPLKTLDAQPEEATPFSGKEAQLAQAARAAVHPRRVRWRWLLLLVAGALAATAVTAALVLPGGEGHTLANVPADSVGIIDPETNDIVDAIKVGESPGAMAAVGTTVYVVNRNSGTVSRLSASRRELDATTGTGGQPSDVAAEQGVVWVSDTFAGTLTGIAQAPGLTRFSIAEGDFALGAGTAMARVENNLWVANSRPPSIGRVDLEGSELIGGVSERIGLRHVPTALAADRQFVWVGSSDGTLSRIDPVSREFRHVETGSWIRAVAVGAGAVWVSTSDGELLRVERHLGITASIEVGVDPTAVAVGAGAVWVADGKSGTVLRVDPVKNRVVARIRLGNRPQDVLVVGEELWVSVRKR